MKADANLAAGFPLPEKLETLWLLALLLPGRAGEEAWARWRETVDDPLDFLRRPRSDRRRALLPLLAVATAERSLALEPTLRAATEAALLRERRRHRDILAICGSLQRALREAGVAATWSGGPMLAEAAWRVPDARHSRGPRLVVPRSEISDVYEAAAQAGFERAPSTAEGARVGCRSLLRHASGLALRPSPSLLDFPAHPELDERVRRRRENLETSAGSFEVPCREHAFLATCANASLVGSSGSLSWIADIYQLVSSTDLDWSEIRELATAARFPLPIGRILRYLRDVFDLPIDPTLIAAHGRESRWRRRELEDLATTVRASGAAPLRNLVASGETRRERARRLLWLAFPSTTWIRRAYGVRGAGGVARAYVGRALRWLGRRRQTAEAPKGTQRRPARPAAASPSRSHRRSVPTVPLAWSPEIAAHRAHEIELLLLGSRTRLDPDAGDRLRELTRGSLDWPYLVRLAENQRTACLLFARLTETEGCNVPSFAVETLRDVVRRTGRLNFLLAGELVRLLERLRAAGIEALSYKGPVLAAAVYGDLALRPTSDLDLLVRPRDLDRTREALAAAGLALSPALDERRLQAHLEEDCELPYRMKRRRIDVELHWRLLNANLDFQVDEQVLWRGAAPIDLGLGRVLAMSDESRLLMLCAHHGVKHFWKKLVWSVDVAELVRSRPGLDWELVAAEAERAGLRRALLVTLQLAADLLDAPVPPTLVAEARRDDAAQALVRWVFGRLFVEPEPRTGKRRRTHVYLQLKPTWSEKVACLRRLFGPTRADREFLALPRALTPLYLLVRPVRLARARLGSALSPRR